MTAREPPQVAALLARLDAGGVRHVVSGSVAAMLHGVALEPGDLDVVPATDADNLARLADVLRALDARPRGPFGDWTRGDDGEWRWTARPTIDADLDAWAPDPADSATYDHLFRTALGDLDVVPWLTGTYDELAPRATTREVDGTSVRVASIGELLARLTVPRRAKDADRVDALRALQREGRGGDPAS